MNGAHCIGSSAGLPATTILNLSPARPMAPRLKGNATADDALLAGVARPPRIGEARPLGALLPQVLARYGLADSAPAGLGCQLDLRA